MQKVEVAIAIDFHDVNIMDALDCATPEQLDLLPFGVVRMDGCGVVTHYNCYESALSGLSPERVVGKKFFERVAPCTNNYMVAFRYTEMHLDDQLDYVFTYRMKPTKVRLRLLRSSSSEYQYLLVEKT